MGLSAFLFGPAMQSDSPKLWDISASIHRDTAVYPGDTPYESTWNARISADCPVNVGTLRMSTHLGTHVDAPLHYDAHGEAAGAMALSAFIGRCRVIHALDSGPLVQWSDLAHAITADLPPRILVRTCAQAAQHWDPNLTALAPEVIAQLHARGVQLIGIDTASIDPADSADLPSHMQVRARQMRILENLVLDAVPEGDYQLIALPLKLMEADASPVRAVLLAL